MRKFELVEGSSRSKAGGALLESRWGYYKRSGVLKVRKLLKLREAQLRALDVQTNPMLKNVFVGVPWPKSSELMGVSGQDRERLPGSKI